MREKERVQSNNNPNNNAADIKFTQQRTDVFVLVGGRRTNSFETSRVGGMITMRKIKSSHG
jgi:hypothetical protein